MKKIIMSFILAGFAGSISAQEQGAVLFDDTAIKAIVKASVDESIREINRVIVTADIEQANFNGFCRAIEFNKDMLTKEVVKQYLQLAQEKLHAIFVLIKRKEDQIKKWSKVKRKTAAAGAAVGAAVGAKIGWDVGNVRGDTMAGLVLGAGVRTVAGAAVGAVAPVPVIAVLRAQKKSLENQSDQVVQIIEFLERLLASMP